jgi:ABC-type multidrug transport system fused ATPase/permease subunit
LVEAGTHAELLAKKGVFSQLWRKQGGKRSSESKV